MKPLKIIFKHIDTLLIILFVFAVYEYYTSKTKMVAITSPFWCDCEPEVLERYKNKNNNNNTPTNSSDFDPFILLKDFYINCYCHDRCNPIIFITW
jgi:hypothetical protein